MRWRRRARRKIAADEKEAIGKAAARLIPDSASLFINIGTTTEAVSNALQETGRFFTHVTGDPVRGPLMGLRALRLVRDQQAYAQAFLDCFWVFGVIALAIIPMAFLMKRSVPEGEVQLGE